MKKFLVLLLFMVGFVFVSQANVSAKTKITYEEALKIAEKANAEIEAEVEKAIMMEAKIKGTPQYEKKLDGIINHLLLRSEKITEKAIKTLNKYGYTAECEYVEVTIGDRVVYVDPIRIHRW